MPRLHETTQEAHPPRMTALLLLFTAAAVDLIIAGVVMVVAAVIDAIDDDVAVVAAAVVVFAFVFLPFSSASKVGEGNQRGQRASTTSSVSASKRCTESR